jgi:colanic acid biosynthesis glycosyl transferase WcaI
VIPTSEVESTGPRAGTPTAVVLYQFFPPDEVVSAKLFGDLSAGLSDRGWKVAAYPSIYGFGDRPFRHAAREAWNGVDIRRVWRPKFRQWSGLGRAMNAVWIAVRWSILALDPRVRPTVVVIGTDPVLSIMVARAWRRFKPKTKVIHWCFDLYPEAAVADGSLNANSFLLRLISLALHKAYGSCDLIVDIGSCMRERLEGYRSPARKATLVPWALNEHSGPVPMDPEERQAVFGNARLGVMYSGSFGRAHSSDEILSLARCMRNDDVQFVFAVSGSRVNDLERAVRVDDSNIRFVSPAPISKLLERLGCADIHVVSLRSEWTGTVVPSKFFGALAAGRPVLFAGSVESAIARWICDLKVGWVLSQENVEKVAHELREYEADPILQERMKQRCHEAYASRFSKAKVIDQWHSELCHLIEITGLETVVSKCNGT